MNSNLLELVPHHIRSKLGNNSRVCLLSGRDVFNALKGENLIVMACNTRISHVIPGIMKAAEELDAVIAFELTRSEGGLDGGYTGQTPESFFNTVIAFAEKTAFTKPFIIHADHITIRDTGREELAAAQRLIASQIEAGYTSFTIDASFNPLPDNIDIVSRLAEPVAAMGYGLELELGESGHALDMPTLTSIAEVRSFLSEVTARNVFPQLLAINNVTRRARYMDGEEVHIDFERTGQIHKVALSHGLAGLVQHGIAGTPINLVGKLADYGIRKGNIGTLWQNVAHAGLPLDLMDAMRRWARENGTDIKYATQAFKAEIDSIPAQNLSQIHEMATREAREFIGAFHAKGSATKLAQSLGRAR